MVTPGLRVKPALWTAPPCPVAHQASQRNTELGRARGDSEGDRSVQDLWRAAACHAGLGIPGGYSSMRSAISCSPMTVMVAPRVVKCSISASEHWTSAGSAQDHPLSLGKQRPSPRQHDEFTVTGLRSPVRRWPCHSAPAPLRPRRRVARIDGARPARPRHAGR